MEKRILTAGFLLIITLPFILFLFGVKMGDSQTENRSLKEKPTLQWKAADFPTFASKGIGLLSAVIDYKNEFNDFYEDHFVFKPLFFSTYYQLQTNVFHTDPIPQKVVKGNDGWYFLGNSYSDVILESKGISYFSKSELEKISQNIDERTAWLNQQGIEYYLSVAPNKHTTYSEFLPILQSEQPTKLSQLKELFFNSHINFVDLSEDLHKHLDQRLFEKTGSHWNGLGGYYGYKTLVKHINTQFPGVGAIGSQDFTISHDTVYQEGLTKMLAINIMEEKLNLNINNPQASQIARRLEVPSTYSGLPEDYEKRYSCPNKPLKVLVFRDSFSNCLLNPMSETFGESVFIWSYIFDPNLILEEKPDIVISEIVERNVDVLLRNNDRPIL